MLAFVLSGGGNRGAFEAGALIAMFEHGLKPDILVGTSAGAMNATFMATNPTLDGAKQLAERWRQIKRSTVFPGNIFTAAWRFVTGKDSLSTNDSLRRYVASQLPPGMKTFGDIKGVRLYTTTANLNTSELFLFGDDPSASLVDAVMCSASTVPLFPPVVLNNWQFVDGATVADVPISIAVAKGASEIYAIDVGTGARPRRDIHGVFNIVQRTVAVLGHQQLIEDFEDVAQNTNVKLHYLSIQSFPEIGDFDHANQFIDEGYRLTNDFLDGKMPPPVAAMGDTAPPGAVKWKKR